MNVAPGMTETSAVPWRARPRVEPREDVRRPRRGGRRPWWSTRRRARVRCSREHADRRPSTTQPHTWLKQTGVVALGVVVAAVMVVLGIWQLDVYERQGSEAADRRAAEAPVSLPSVAPRAGPCRTGSAGGSPSPAPYDPSLQVLVPTDGGYRVLTGLEQADGSIVAVVRGVEPDAEQPVPPSGEVTRTGCCCRRRRRRRRPPCSPRARCRP